MPWGEFTAFQEEHEIHVHYVQKEASYIAPGIQDQLRRTFFGCMVREGYLTWRTENGVPEWRTARPAEGKLTPSILLSDFFVKYYENIPENVKEHTAMGKCRRMGANLVLAVTMVHELAHCVDWYPESKPKILDELGEKRFCFASEADAKRQHSLALSSEPGYSWERPVLGGGELGFTKDVYIREGENTDKDHTGGNLIVAQYQNRAPRPGNTDASALSPATYNVTTYQLTERYSHHRRVLLPNNWVANWFQASHWTEESTGDEIVASPKDVWMMFTNVPWPQDRAALNDRIVRVWFKKTARPMADGKEDKNMVEQDLLERNDGKTEEGLGRKRSLSEVSVKGGDEPPKKTSKA